jgi:hypothetical protein
LGCMKSSVRENTPALALALALALLRAGRHLRRWQHHRAGAQVHRCAVSNGMLPARQWGLARSGACKRAARRGPTCCT